MTTSVSQAPPQAAPPHKLGLVRGTIRTAGEVMLTLGTLLLLFVAWQLWWTDVQANRVQQDIADDLIQDWDTDPAPAPVADPDADPAVEPAIAVPEVEFGAAFALLRVPEFGSNYVRPIVEGTTLDVLEDGIGHYDGAALPGQVGNFALAGHRVTYGKPFNLIAELDQGDPIVVETREGWLVYRVYESAVVTPQDVDVVAPVPNDPTAVPTEKILTMTACHPMFSARERYIVHAKLDETRTRNQGPPQALTQG